MDKATEKIKMDALHKALDGLLIGASVLALVTGSATLKSSTSQPHSLASSTGPTVGTTYKKRTQAYLDTGEERTVVETYTLNQAMQWELVDVKIEDAPSA